MAISIADDELFFPPARFPCYVSRSISVLHLTAYRTESLLSLEHVHQVQMDV